MTGEINVAAFALCEKIARAVEAVVPPGFRAKVSLTVDSGTVLPHNVELTVRPPQPKDGKRM